MPVAIFGYHEPSVVFDLGTKTQVTSLNGVAGHVLENQEAIIISPCGDLTQFSKMALGRVKARQAGRVRGN